MSTQMPLSPQHVESGGQSRLISIIVPCFNEEANIADCIAAVTEVMEKSPDKYEIIAVNDGSQDNTLQVLSDLERKHPKLVVLDMMRNSGQTAAYQAGLDVASGSYVLLFSGDLEIPAEQIPKVVDQLDSGCDFINTQRIGRSGSSRLKSKIANGLLNRISGLSLSDRGSGLKGMSSELAKSLQLYGEWHRFLPDLASIYTSRIIEFKVPFEERKAGVSSYKAKLKSLAVIFDLVTVAFTIHSQRKPYRFLPGRLFGFVGLVIGAVGLTISAWLVAGKLFFGASLADRPLFLVSIMTTSIGLMMIMFGMIGELIMQVYVRQHQVRLPRECSRLVRKAPHE